MKHKVEFGSFGQFSLLLVEAEIRTGIRLCLAGGAVSAQPWPTIRGPWHPVLNGVVLVDVAGSCSVPSARDLVVGGTLGVKAFVEAL